MSEPAEPHLDSRAAPPRVALFALGFRPFFLLAMAAAVGMVALWSFAYRGVFAFDAYYGALLWHAHEMIFGFAAAVMAGFLLTAVGNWTGTPTLTRGPLATLAGLWLAGRVLPFLHGTLPDWSIAAVDLAFAPALALSIAIPLVRNAPSPNLIFVPVLVLFTVANALVHVGRPGGSLATARIGLYLGIDIVLLLIAIVGGRVLPFFTERALPGAAPVKRRWLEPIAIGAVLVLALVRPFSPPPALLTGVAALAAAAHALRLVGWHDRRVWSVPLLWVLYLGYGWLVLGFALTALAAAGRVSPFLALHALTSGAIGAMTLGMMARVALGHTGRPLKPARLTVLAFALVHVAAALRVFAPLLAPAWTADFVLISALLWIAAFGCALEVYAGKLIGPRADGLPG